MGAIFLVCTDFTPAKFRCVEGEEGFPASVPHILPAPKGSH